MKQCSEAMLMVTVIMLIQLIVIADNNLAAGVEQDGGVSRLLPSQL